MFFWIFSLSSIDKMKSYSAASFVNLIVPRIYRPCRFNHFYSTNGLSSSCGRSEPIAKAEHLFSYWAKTGKSWKRLGPIIELAIAPTGRLADKPTQQWSKLKSIADVGTDHGLLAFGLAMTGQFDQVVGVDVSEQALTEGAYKLQDEIRLFSKTNETGLPVEFRLSDGLAALAPGEADVICIAGMGVHTMVEILTTATGTHHDPLLLRLDELDCARLVLQPTNARPHLLTSLYSKLHEIGWYVNDERIEYLSSRWYLSISFERRSNEQMFSSLPGSLLARSVDGTTNALFEGWVTHHCRWIRLDTSLTATIREEDRNWLEAFGSMNAANATQPNN